MKPHAATISGNAESRAAELLKSNEAQQEEILKLRRERDQLAKQLADAQVSGQTDRQARRAALNLMEDAIRFRAAEQRENAERRRAEEALRKADTQKDEFLAILAHELRNPLAPIRNSVQILRAAEAGTIVTEEVYAMLDRQVNHMVRLVDDLMELSRISNGQIELQKERIDFSAVARNAIEISRQSMEEARHQFDVSLPPAAVFLEGDTVRLTQVFANLLNNAAKYTPQGGRISFVAEQDHAELVVTVRDNGIGIAPDMLMPIFDLFVQGERRLNQPSSGTGRFASGLGIGLTLVRRLVQLHGGTISARSDGAGHGSEFTVRLPVARTEASKPSVGSEQACAPPMASRRILVVDDNQDAADSLAMLLKYLGAEVSVAHSGRSALAKLETFRPEMMLLDIGMPEMDGHEVARRVRQTSVGQNVMLVALTGWGQADDRRRSREAGFNHHMIKPVELRALQSLLDKPASNETPARNETPASSEPPARDDLSSH